MGKGQSPQSNLIGVSVSDSLLILFQAFITNIAAIVYFMIAARILSVENVGILLFSSVLINLIVTLFSFSFNYTSSRFFALFSFTKNDAKLYSLTKIVLFVNIIAILAGTPLGLLISYIFFLNSIPNIAFLLSLMVSVDGVINSIIYNFYGLLVGQSNIQKAVVGYTMANVLRYVLSVYVILAYGNIVQVLFSWIIGDAIGSLYLFISLRKFIINSSRISLNDLKSMFRYTLPIYISSILTYLYLYIDRFQAFLLSNIQSFAIYGAALTASMIFINVSQMISNVLLPNFVNAFKKGSEDFKELISGITKFLDVSLLPLIIIASMISQPIISLFAGQNFSSGWITFFIVSLTFSFTLPISILYTFYLTIGKTKILMVSTITSIIISLIVTLVLHNYLGTFGISIGRSTLFILNFILLSYLTAKKERLDYGISTHLKVVMVSLAFFSPLSIFSFFNFSISYYFLLPLCFFYLLLYIALLTRLRFLDNNELKFITSSLPIFIQIIIHKAYYVTQLNTKKLKNNIKIPLPATVTYSGFKIYSAFYNPDLIRIRSQ